MDRAALHIRGLTKTYRRGWRGRVHALQGLDMTIAPGSAVGFLGPNGAGKTTTLHAVLGLVGVDAGAIEVFGRDPRDPETRRDIGYQTESFSGYRSHDAWQSLLFFGQLGGLSRHTLQGRIPQVLDAVGLTEVAQQRVRTFSKGMKQRFSLALALLGEPRLLLLDEPHSGLDPEGRRDITNLLLEQRRRGVTLLVASHILDDIERLCDEVVIIHRGRCVKHVSLDEQPGEASRQSLEETYFAAMESLGT